MILSSLSNLVSLRRIRSASPNSLYESNLTAASSASRSRRLRILHLLQKRILQLLQILMVLQLSGSQIPHDPYNAPSYNNGNKGSLPHRHTNLAQEVFNASSFFANKIKQPKYRWNKAEYDKTCLDDLSPIPSFSLVSPVSIKSRSPARYPSIPHIMGSLLHKCSPITPINDTATITRYTPEEIK